MSQRASLPWSRVNPEPGGIGRFASARVSPYTVLAMSGSEIAQNSLARQPLVPLGQKRISIRLMKSGMAHEAGAACGRSHGYSMMATTGRPSDASAARVKKPPSAQPTTLLLRSSAAIEPPRLRGIMCLTENGWTAWLTRHYI
jgi:hypothetical protein